MNTDVPTSWAELAAGMTEGLRDTVLWLVTPDSLGRGAVLALVLTTAALLAGAFATDLGSPVDGPILTENERNRP